MPPIVLARRAGVRYNGRHAEEHLEILRRRVPRRASYGVMAATIKCALAEGFSWTQTAASQAFFGALLFAVAWPR